ncbi:hypothetical protein K439DRAFT_1623432 [Ramaria rubella]|nr:hypothetical protein K439DRAFT_1623432 [Ramaria rubella]
MVSSPEEAKSSDSTVPPLKSTECHENPQDIERGPSPRRSETKTWLSPDFPRLPQIFDSFLPSEMGSNLSLPLSTQELASLAKNKDESQTRESINQRKPGVERRYARFWHSTGVVILIVSGVALVGPAIYQPQYSYSTAESTVSAKWAITILSVLTATIVTITYGILIGPGTRMRSTSKLPLVPIAHNITTLLELAWPDSSNSPACGAMGGLVDVPDAIRLLYLGKMKENKRRAARGMRQCEAAPDVHLDTPPLWLTSGSLITTSIVRLAIWEWMSLWMNFAMVAATLLYNGLLTNEPGRDGYVRLTLVLVYAVAYCAHAMYVWHAITTFFTMVSAGAAWSMLNTANFAVVDLQQYTERLNSLTTSLEFRLINKANSEFKPGSYIADLAHEACDGDESPGADGAGSDSNQLTFSPSSTIISSDSEANKVRDAQVTIRTRAGREREIAIDAADTALGYVVVNGMVMAAIILWSGLATWTFAPVDCDISITQLGSLGTFALISLGTMVMFTSATHLKVMNSSFQQILLLKEVAINGHEIMYAKKSPSLNRAIGFMYGEAKIHRMRMRDVMEGMNLWDTLCFILFGPAYALLPSEEDSTMQSAGLQWQLTVNVRGETVVLTTGSTSRHNKGSQDVSNEAIKVCFRPTATHEKLDGSASKMGFSLWCVDSTDETPVKTPR